MVKLLQITNQVVKLQKATHINQNELHKKYYISPK